MIEYALRTCMCGNATPFPLCARLLQHTANFLAAAGANLWPGFEISVGGSQELFQQASDQLRFTGLVQTEDPLALRVVVES